MNKIVTKSNLATIYFFFSFPMMRSFISQDGKRSNASQFRIYATRVSPATKFRGYETVGGAQPVAALVSLCLGEPFPSPPRPRRLTMTLKLPGKFNSRLDMYPALAQLARSAMREEKRRKIMADGRQSQSGTSCPGKTRRRNNRAPFDNTN